MTPKEVLALIRVNWHPGNLSLNAAADWEMTSSPAVICFDLVFFIATSWATSGGVLSSWGKRRGNQHNTSSFIFT